MTPFANETRKCEFVADINRELALLLESYHKDLLKNQKGKLGDPFTVKVNFLSFLSRDVLIELLRKTYRFNEAEIIRIFNERNDNLDRWLDVEETLRSRKLLRHVGERSRKDY
jgi:hypothetical protein